jgi:hypothetical protein
MGLPSDRGELDGDLGQTSIEGGWIRRPADRLHAVPEGFAFERVVEEERIAEVAQDPSGDGVHLRLMTE